MKRKSIALRIAIASAVLVLEGLLIVLTARSMLRDETQNQVNGVMIMLLLLTVLTLLVALLILFMSVRKKRWASSDANKSLQAAKPYHLRRTKLRRAPPSTGSVC